ncbi:MAG: protoporphyrinogen oxidase [Magnetococcales bacterium]|nr:protoporphyrinogen oxidase [Magnetococcales bacterium]NGZ07229.1 protoporphyrinogen oxidase [Magnetococcales bacterium]
MNTLESSGKIWILGGGISGLALAWFLHRRGVAVTVLEAAERPGGTIRTVESQGYRVELGPNSTLQKPGERRDALGRLVEELGLGSRLIEAAPEAARRYVMRRGRLLPLPETPPAFLLSPLFSPWAKLRLLKEPLVGWVQHEESIAAFVRRRLGPEFLDYAVEPFISGVYAGDPRDLSVAAAVPRIHDVEQRFGSLIVGGFMMGRAKQAMGAPRGRLVSFDEGMELLPATLAQRLPPGSVRCHHEVVGLRPVEGGGWQIEWKNRHGEQGLEQADQVVMAMPAHAAARVLFTTLPVASRILSSIAYAPIVSMACGYERRQVAHPLDGFGFLLPRREQVRTLGALFSSSLFPERAPEGRILLTAFLGGAMDQTALTMPQGAVAEWIQKDLTDCLTITGSPEFTRLTRYHAAIPQYHVGHHKRLEALDQALQPYSGIHMRANWRDGVSVYDCVWNAERLAKRLTGEEETEEEHLLL